METNDFGDICIDGSSLGLERLRERVREARRERPPNVRVRLANGRADAAKHGALLADGFTVVGVERGRDRAYTLLATPVRAALPALRPLPVLDVRVVVVWWDWWAEAERLLVADAERQAAPPATTPYLDETLEAAALRCVIETCAERVAYRGVLGFLQTERHAGRSTLQLLTVVARGPGTSPDPDAARYPPGVAWVTERELAAASPKWAACLAGRHAAVLEECEGPWGRLYRRPASAPSPWYGPRA